MLVGAIEIFANHPAIIVGSTAPSEVGLGEGPANSDGRHVVIRTRGQVGLTRVSLWSRAMPRIGDVVFDGELDLDEYMICVTDTERLSRYTRKLAMTNAQRIVVSVDDPGYASRVHVGLDLGARDVELTAVAGHPLPTVMMSAAQKFVPVNELGLILNDYDSPLARLAGAVKLISRPRPGAKGYPSNFDIQMLAEWLRRLAADLSFDRAEALSMMVTDRLRSEQDASTLTRFAGVSDIIALEIATYIMGDVEKGPGVSGA